MGAITALPLNGVLQTKEGVVVARWSHTSPQEDPRYPNGVITLLVRDGPVTEVALLQGSEGVGTLYEFIQKNPGLELVDKHPKDPS